MRNIGRILPRAADDDELFWCDATPPENSSGCGPHAVALVEHRQRHTVRDELLECRATHDAVVRLRRCEERLGFARIVDEIDVAAYVETERRMPAVQTVAGDAIVFTRASGDPARDIGHDLPLFERVHHE